LINLQVGTTATALYQYCLTSIDPDLLYSYAPTLDQKMKTSHLFSQVSSDLRNLQPQWSLHILRDKASNLNVNAQDVENFFSYAYSDNKISQINGIINQYNVIIETLPDFYKDPTILSKLYVRSNTGGLVPLSEILEPKETVGPLTINHVNGLPAVGISFNPGYGVPLGDSLNQIEKFIADKPPQIGASLVGTAQIYTESFESLSYLLILAFFVIYVLLGILYESFIHPLTVMSALPPALFGGLLSLYLAGETLSLYSFVGLILLVGIVLKNGIMMVDFAIDAVRIEKKNACDAIIEASLIRFRPILMTTLCALMGAIPIALGAGGMVTQTTRPLGICIVGGLIFSQAITLLLTPVLYYYFETIQEKICQKFKKNGGNPPPTSA
jgi:HAE1 family hydrophobic/amphiphilic exporter-1